MTATQKTDGAAAAKDLLVLELEHRPFGPDETLIYYDGPQLMWLRTASSRYLAVALPQDAGRWPFLLVALTDAAQLALETGALSLRRAFTENGPIWVLPDYDADVLTAHRINQVPGDWLPGDVPLL